MKSLSPSMRENKRYLLLEGRDLRKRIESCILEFIGSKGFSRIGLQSIEFSKDSAIIAINREVLNDVRAAFALSEERILVKRVSGTLAGLRGN
jgi:RNase P/RNase MRP subunit POP5